MHAMDFLERIREEEDIESHQRARFGTERRSTGEWFVCTGVKKYTRREKRMSR